VKIPSTLQSLPPARIVNWLILAISIWGMLNIAKWRDERNSVMTWDVVAYYAYLPVTFIYGDLSLKFIDGYNGNHKFVIWPEKSPNGGKIIKTSMGLSILYSPFFFVGHILAKISGYDAGGYSLPYRMTLMLSLIFYLGIALFYIRKILQKYFSQTVIIITSVVLVYGTTIFHYSTYDIPITHIYSFAIISAFIYHSICWHDKPGIRQTVFLGLLAGLISLIRPTNIIIILFFIFYNVSSIKDFRIRISLFMKYWGHIAIMIILGFLFWLPQFLYWHKVTGQFIYYSYPNERFFWNDPKIIEGLFGYRKGWLLYSPLMILSLAGIYFLFKNRKEFFLPVLLFTLLNIYIITSWWCWWYGGCYGMRPMMDSYGLLAIPLASSISFFISLKRIPRILTFIVIACFIALSLFQSTQYRLGAIHYDSMTKKAYWTTFLKLHPTDEFTRELVHPDTEKSLNGDR
jgi:hypothetical protein